MSFVLQRRRTHGDMPTMDSAQHAVPTPPLELCTRQKVTMPVTLDASSKDAKHAGYARLQVSVSGITDAGGWGRENQDAFFTLCDAEHDAMTLGVFDGHGRDTGAHAAMTAKAFFEAQFRAFKASDYARLEAAPLRVLAEMFAMCHVMIKSVFRSIYEQRGYRVQDDRVNGSLVRHECSSACGKACIRGGTTATIVVILRGGAKIITAHVGDSAARIGSSVAVLTQKDVTLSMRNDTAWTNEKLSPSRRFDDEIQLTNVALTGNHGADNESEFLRIRRHSPESPLQFVYDCASNNATSHRTPVFSVSPKGLLQRNMTGDYYKNVRDEWATVVATPADAPFRDFLAFTRSLGDFHMHGYGVSEEPTVKELALDELTARWSASKRRIQGTPSSPEAVDGTDEDNQTHVDHGAPRELFLVVASDGIWDNWKYDELFSFLAKHAHDDKAEVPVSPAWPSNQHEECKEGCLHAKSAGEDGGQCRVDRLALALMDSNLRRANRVFGDQADNMTAIVCRITIAHE